MSQRPPTWVEALLGWRRAAAKYRRCRSPNSRAVEPLVDGGLITEVTMLELPGTAGIPASHKLQID
jgi:hypothetical protein